MGVTTTESKLFADTLEFPLDASTWLDLVSNVYGRDEEKVDEAFIPRCIPTMPTTLLIVPTTPDTRTLGDDAYTGYGSEEHTLGAKIGVKAMVC